ncbi:MAG: FxsA family protein [Gemmatimonadetes bacterium]|nr:FxsA family protein [Gemmatimonadota bacterium]MBT4613026.1 FxsA family protein [Gemmatimonadota bacterium]MBT5057007.1 FxsA family protein [Gemmatimonadota bacterium]MBT5142260.1 FxsA family protein [Gemmatimonadota bacterium]MBT5589155.1 FxsA family protein [Gemmatimonadota bacterium]
MLLKLFLMFTLIPVIELALLVEVGSRIGVTLTIAVVLLTGAAGAWLARSQGLRALVRLQEALRAVQFPGDEIFDGVLILGGGLLLLTPGFLTDLLGLSVLIPGSRHLIKAALKGTVRRRMHTGDLRVNTTYTVSDS